MKFELRKTTSLKIIKQEKLKRQSLQSMPNLYYLSFKIIVECFSYFDIAKFTDG